MLSAEGFVRDYGDLDPLKAWINDTLDHRHLNEVVPINPTAENIARWIFSEWSSRIPEISSIGVSETEKTWAEYSSDFDGR